MGFPTEFKYGLNQMVEVRISGEYGEVKAQGKWATGNIAYQVLYQAKDGTAQERWFDEVDLIALVDERYVGCPIYSVNAEDVPKDAIIQ